LRKVLADSEPDGSKSAFTLRVLLAYSNPSLLGEDWGLDNLNLFMKRILLIDSDAKFIAELQTALARKCELLAAMDVPTAIRILWRTPVDMIFLAAKLPKFFSNQEEAEGLAVLRWLKASTHTRIPVVILTENSSQEIQWEGLQLGAKGRVVKASGIGELIEMVGNGE